MSQKNLKNINKDSLHKLADNLVYEIKKSIDKFKTEEDLKISFEKLLDPIKKRT
jgi:hypothetical protein